MPGRARRWAPAKLLMGSLPVHRTTESRSPERTLPAVAVLDRVHRSRVQRRHADRHDAGLLRHRHRDHLSAVADLVGHSDGLRGRRADDCCGPLPAVPPDAGGVARSHAVTGVPVVMDVDTGIDDAFALMFAVRHPGIDLRAVSCVAGNASVDHVVANTCYVLDAAGAGDIPVGRGASAPLLGPTPDTGHFPGLDGLGGFSRPSDRRTSALSALDLLRHELLAAVGNGEPVTLVPTGPLTNIALLLRAHPEVAAGIERIVFMGGSASAGNVTAVAEFNVL